MKGLVLFSDGSYALKEMPEPELGRNVYAPHDVLIEVAYCGICGSDVHKWEDSDKKGVSSPTSAVVTGHEIVGTVKAVGREVTDVKVGDRVVCELVTFYCGRCINCKTGRINICCNMPSMQQRAHYVTGGGYARNTVWPAKHVHVLPPGISLEEGTLIEPTAGSVHSVIERMKVQAGESVIILGPGARGLILLQIAKACGASPVVITGLSRDERTRLALARQLGADAVINVEKVDLVNLPDEVKPPVLADAIVEVTETGSSLRANRLRIIDIVMESNTQLIANAKATADPWKKTKIDNIALLLRAAIEAQGRVGLMLNVQRENLPNVLALLPALQRPTVSPLSDADWVAVNTIIEERTVRELIPRLKAANAQGIVEYPLNKIVV